MLFSVGVEEPSNENEAWGIVVPIFEKLGYGCFSAADERKEIPLRAKEAILTVVEEALSDGHLLSALEDDFQSYQTQYPAHTRWLLLEVPVEQFKGRQKRINITLAEPLLARVDAFVAFHKEFKDRSDFLAKAADQLISNCHSQPRVQHKG